MALTLTTVPRWICQNVGGIEPVDQFPDRQPDRCLAARRDHQRVFVIGSKVEHFVDGDEVEILAVRGGDPAQVVACVVEPRRQQFHEAIETRRGRAHLRLKPFHRLGQTRGGDRLHHVIDGALLEGGDGELVEGGDERDVAPALRLPGHVEAGHARHLDIQEQDVGLVLVDGVQRGNAVGRFRADLKLRPQPPERQLELGAQHRLVFGDHCLNVAHKATPGWLATRRLRARAVRSARRRRTTFATVPGRCRRFRYPTNPHRRMRRCSRSR